LFVVPRTVAARTVMLDQVCRRCRGAGVVARRACRGACTWTAKGRALGRGTSLV